MDTDGKRETKKVFHSPLIQSVNVPPPFHYSLNSVPRDCPTQTAQSSVTEIQIKRTGRRRGEEQKEEGTRKGGLQKTQIYEFYILHRRCSLHLRRDLKKTAQVLVSPVVRLLVCSRNKQTKKTPQKFNLLCQVQCTRCTKQIKEVRGQTQDCFMR